MNLIRLVANRIIKLIANITKILSYLFHFIFPNKRFTIPKHSKPLFKSKKSSVIPKIIWQTNYTNKVSLPIYLNYLFNRLMAISYEYYYYSNKDIEDFIKHNSNNETYNIYKQINDGAAIADLWRVIVLNIKGGVYLDIDAHLVWSLDGILTRQAKELFVIRRGTHYTNYFLASAPNNPILDKTIKLILDNIKNKKVKQGVYFLTGPDVLNQAIGNTKVNSKLYKYVCVQGSFTNEHFQYIDKKQGKWNYTKPENILK